MNNNNNRASEMSRAGLGTGASMRNLRLFIFECDLRAAVALRAASSAESGAANRNAEDVFRAMEPLPQQRHNVCV